MTPTLTDEDGRKAYYTLTPNSGGMTMTVNTEEAKAFDAEAFADQAYLDFHSGAYMIDAIKKQVQAAYEAGKSEAVPDGWQLVPIEPTENMKHAFHSVEDGRFYRPKPQEYWSAMLSASPKAGE